MISGFGIPVDLDRESLTMGYVFKANYYLPSNASNYIDFLADPFEKESLVPISGGRRRRSNEENAVVFNDSPSDLNVDDEVYAGDNLVMNEPNKLSESRFTLYKGLEKMAETHGLPGRPCLLRTICETAEVPFSYDNGILGELAHLIMT